MSVKRKVEIFSAGCPFCVEQIQQIEAVACSSCEVEVLDVNDSKVAERAIQLGVRSIPAVAIDGVLAECCNGGGVDMDVLKASGLGESL